MATNRKRTRRTPKSKIPVRISKRYREELRAKDFLGRLEDHEVPVAIRAGVHRWNLWKRAGKIATLTAELHHKGYRLAPVFDGSGEIDTQRYSENVKFLVKNYQDLELKLAEKR